MNNTEKGYFLDDQEIENGKDAKTEQFFEQQEIMEKIKDMGFAQYAKTLPNLPDAFDLEKNTPTEELERCVCCMDERTGYGLHAAGGGILLSDSEFDTFFKKAKPDAISSHDGCGAAKLYAKKMGLDETNSDAIGREWVEKKAKEMGIEHIHLGVDKPAHYARVCYYDATGKFNYMAVEGLPAGFVVGRKYMTKKSSLAEGAVAEKIMMGDHGFGPELFTKENPFLLVAIAETEDEIEDLKKELLELKKDSKNSIAVDGFLMPKVEVESMAYQESV